MIIRGTGLITHRIHICRTECLCVVMDATIVGALDTSSPTVNPWPLTWQKGKLKLMRKDPRLT